jgi:hypothetical protein
MADSGTCAVDPLNIPMLSLKRLSSLLLLAVALATPSFAQTYWKSESPAGVTDDIWCVAYGNGTFAATTNLGKVLTSSDGLTWSSQTVAAGTWLVSITYGNGTWVAVGANGTILLSSDLENWINAKSVTTNKLNGVAYTGTTFIAVGDAGTIITSPDAQTWTVRSSGVTTFLHGITFDSTGANLVISGQNGVLLASGNSGATFAPAASGTTDDLENILANPAADQMVAVGSSGAIIEATNGFGTGSTWTAAQVPATTARFRGLAYGDGSYVAAGEQGTIETSTDGIKWVQRFSGDSYSTLSAATLLGAAYSSTLQRFVVVGTGGTILVSNPTPTVFANVATRGTVSSTQTLIGGFVVEGTAPRTVLIRADGPTLSTFGVTGALADPVLKIYDSNQNLVATNTGWSTSTNPSPKELTTAALTAGAFPLPAGSADSAVLVTLPPGAYTAVITSASNGTGVALFEAYTD